MQAIFVSLYGDVDEKQLRSYAMDVRDEINDLYGSFFSGKLLEPMIWKSELEVSENTLRKYQLTFDEIALAIRSSSLDLPAELLKPIKAMCCLQFGSGGYER